MPTTAIPNGSSPRAAPTGSAGINDHFHRFAAFSSRIVGSPWTFVGSILVIVLWAASGPMFGYSDTWQLVINTGTTIVTFRMVFLVQNTQNRDAKALHLKLDELLRALGEARNRLVDLENLSEAELDQLQKEFEQVRQRAFDEGGDRLRFQRCISSAK